MGRAAKDTVPADPADPTTPEVAAPQEFNFGDFAERIVAAVKDAATAEAATQKAADADSPEPGDATVAHTVQAATPAPVAAEPQLVPQFGGAPIEAADSVPSVSSEGGYVALLPLLTTGAYGPVVALLAKLLDQAGFPNHVHAGKTAPMLDDALMALVRQFQGTVGVDPSKPQDGAAPLIRKDHEGLVDAKTWQALLGGLEHAIEDRYPLHPMLQEAVA